MKSKCIEYKLSKDGKGYGMLKIRGLTFKAHRLSYRLFKGSIGYKLQVCHKCDNPSCINPEHLFLGTNQENQIDSVRKGRHWSTKKKECLKGHPLSGSNLYARKDGTRECKECRRENVRRWRSK